MIQYSGTPFQYNPAITNIDIDSKLAGILAQFDDDYIMDVVKDSLNNKFRVYDLPRPNIVSAFEANFKQLTEGFSSNVDKIAETRKDVYLNIIYIICDYYDFTFELKDDTDIYSVAYWLYEVFVSNFTNGLMNFYVGYFIREKDALNSALGLLQLKKENDPSFSYSKKLFKDPKLAAIHCNLEYVINEIQEIDINLEYILTCIFATNPTVPTYLSSYITDTGNFFKNHYENYILNSKESADVLIYIKLSLQELAGNIEPIEEINNN